METLKRHGKRLLLESLGWILVVLGIAALVLPGPGLLLLFAGLSLLAYQYEWAERRLAPVRRAAVKTAAESVKSWHRILTSTAFSLMLVALGVYWCINPPAPTWWPLDDKWWLMGGWGAGATIIVSGIFAMTMITYSVVAHRKSKGKHKLL